MVVARVAASDFQGDGFPLDFDLLRRAGYIYGYPTPRAPLACWSRGPARVFLRCCDEGWR